jgi:hypothetical protein
MLRKTVLLTGVVTLFVCGCALFTPPKEAPVDQDYVGTYFGRLFGQRTTNVFSLTPERRIVIVMPHEGENYFCAEPSPDVAENIAGTWRALVKAETKEKLTSGEAQAYSSFASSTSNLFFRSQGIQLFRDGMYNLCQAYINKAITAEQYREKYTQLLDKSSTLISQELAQVDKKALQDALVKANAALNSAESAKQQAVAAKDETMKALEEIKKSQK